MFVEERLEKIMKILNEKGRITVKEVNELHGISEDTVRRDFSRLSEKGLVIRTHGGIISKNNVIFDHSLSQKIIEYNEEKELIGEKAASLVNDSDVIIIDAGTTTETMVENLEKIKNLTILTNALNIAVKAVKFKEITTIIIGGIIRNETLGIVGPDSVNMIKNYRADKLFLAASGISISEGLVTPNRMEAEIKKELIKIANKVIVLADSSKINKTSLFSFSTVADISTLITDKSVDPEFISELKKNNIEVLIVNK